MRNTLVNFNDENKDYLYYEFYKRNQGKTHNPKKSMLKFIAKSADITLTEKQKMYFNEFFINGKTVNQIAMEFGRDKSTVSRQITRVKQKLKSLTPLYFN